MPTDGVASTSALVTTMYRTMATDGSAPNLPVLGPEDLGCRVWAPGPPKPYDVRPDSSGMVGTRAKPEGMSAFDDPRELPAHLKPPSLGGTGRRPVWAMGVSDLPASLAFRLSRRSHGVVAPIQPVHLDEYQKSLAATQASWSVSHV